MDHGVMDDFSTVAWYININMRTRMVVSHFSLQLEIANFSEALANQYITTCCHCPKMKCTTMKPLKTLNSR
jgi:hypothetical protein